MVGVCVLLLIVTMAIKPSLFTNYTFWIHQLPKFLIMIGVSVIGGLICRYFCTVDEQGYILTNESSTAD